MSNDNPDEDLDRDERIRNPVTTLQLFRDAWEELRRERVEDLTVRNVQILTRDGETKQLSCLEFWVEMFEQVTKQKLRPDYLYSLVAEQQIWERFTVTLEFPTDNESAICVHGLYYTPRPSNQYLQNLNLRYDQWFIVQDFPPRPKVIKILRRRCGSPSCSDEEIIRRLVQAMDWSTATPSRNVQSRCITENGEKISGEGTNRYTISPNTVARAISDATANTLPNGSARAILNVTSNSSPDRIARAILNVTPNSSPINVTPAILDVPPNSPSETVHSEISIPGDLQNGKTPMPIDNSQKLITPIVTQKERLTKIGSLPVLNTHYNQSLIGDRRQQPTRFDQVDFRTRTPQQWVRFNQLPGDRRSITPQQWMRFAQQQGDHRPGYQQQWMRYVQQQGARRLAYQQHFKQNSPYYSRGRGFRLQRAFRQRPSLLQQLPLSPSPAHLPLTYLNPRFPYPAHRANPHYDSAWNYSNIFSPFQVVPWDGANNPLTTLPQAVPQIYTQMPYVQIPGPYWMPTENSQLSQSISSSVIIQNPWTPQSEAIGISSEPKYYPAENFQAAHLSTYQDPILPQDDHIETQYPDINNTVAHQSSIGHIENIQPSDKTTLHMLRAKDTAARQLEMNCRKIESHPLIDDTTKIQNPITILQRSGNISANRKSEKSGETQSVWTAQTPLSSAIPLSERQSVDTNVEPERNGQTQKAQLLNDSEIFKVPLPVSKPTWRKSTVGNQSQKQSGQKRKAVQFSKAIPGKDSKTTKQDTQKSHEDKENKNPIDEREYLQTPSIFEILESRKKADPKEREKAPTNYMEDVVQRKERRWKSMDVVPGSPRLDIVLDMIRRDNEMLEEEERLKREKGKSQNVDNSLKEKNSTSSKLTKDEKSSHAKSWIFQHVSAQIASQTDINKRKELQIIKNLESIQYTKTDELTPLETQDVKPSVKSLPTFVTTKLYDEDEAMHIIIKQEEPVQSEEIPAEVSSDKIVQETPVCQQSDENTAVTVRKLDELNVEIDNDEMALLDNLTISKERFSPELWVPDNIVLELKNKGLVKQKKPKSSNQPIASTSETAVEKKICKIQKLAKRPSHSPIKKQTSNNDQPINKKKKKSSRECSTTKTESKEPVKYSARDQATQTSDIEYDDNTVVLAVTKEESSQANEEIKPELLSYAAIVRKNKKN